METLVVRRKFINLGGGGNKKIIEIFALNRLPKRDSTGLLLRQKRKDPRNKVREIEERKRATELFNMWLNLNKYGL